MKNYLKTSRWLRFVAAGAFGLMLVLNIMVSLDFDKDKLLPSLTLVELGNQAYAQSEDDGELCDEPTDQCGPLMGNEAGTRYCCANTDSSCCYSAGC